MSEINEYKNMSEIDLLTFQFLFLDENGRTTIKKIVDDIRKRKGKPPRTSDYRCAFCGEDYIAAPGADAVWFSCGCMDQNDIGISFRVSYATVFRLFLKDAFSTYKGLLSGDWHKWKSPEFIKYQEYLESEEWKNKANDAKRHAGYRCQVCNRGKSIKLEAHHRTYIRLGNEMPEDITVLCDECHEIFTKHYSYDAIGNLFRRK